MPRFAANLTLLFTEYPFLDRFAAAADAGFDAVEVLFPYDQDPEAIAQALQRHGLEAALFNMPPGDYAVGERGLAALPERCADLQQSFEKALAYAQACGVTRLHLMAGLALQTAAAAAAYRRAVSEAAAFFAPHGIDVMIEPINQRDVPGYYLADFALARDLIAALALPNLKLQFDVYHCQILHGDVTTLLRALLPMIGHIQIASVPSRNEPDGEELNYPFLFAELDRLGYQGFVACEYRPRTTTREGLGWFAPYRRR